MSIVNICSCRYFLIYLFVYLFRLPFMHYVFYIFKPISLLRIQIIDFDAGDFGPRDPEMWCSGPVGFWRDNLYRYFPQVG